MKKFTSSIVILVILLSGVLFSGCTENGKDIGKEMPLEIVDKVLTDGIWDLFGPITADDGWAFVILKVKATNKYSEPLGPLGLLEFSLIIEQQTYEAEWLKTVEYDYRFEEKDFGSDTTIIQPNGYIEGWMIFEVPDDVEQKLSVELRFTDIAIIGGGDFSSTSFIPEGFTEYLPFNIKPTAYPGSNIKIFLDEEHSFDGSASTDPEGMELDYKWDWGDESISYGTEAIETHEYNGLGEFTVSLSVTDPGGLSDSDSIKVVVNHFFEMNIQNAIITDGIWSEYNPDTPDNGYLYFIVNVRAENIAKFKVDEISYLDFTLSLNNFNYDPHGILSIEDDYRFEGKDLGINFGKLDNNEINEGWIVFEVPDSIMDYSVIQLQFVDNEFFEGDRELITNIQVSMVEEKIPYNSPPEAIITSDTNAFIDEEITFDGSASTDPEDMELDFEWDWGDESSYGGYDEVETHSYDTLDTFTVTLIVTDIGSATDSDEMRITITHYFQITIINHGWHETQGLYDFHEGDYEVKIKMKNLAGETKDVWSTFWDLITTDGSGYDWNGDDGNNPSSLGSGSQATWIIYFDVPQGKTPEKIIYDNILEKSLS